ncbi:hypothetical protein QBC47DRAFT_431501 [Echria macrotheca]|uniref:NodB homology domain-containing protein n=1 Tax=Echria macrotheca TaxID=438768 RepID=A0AAJ0B7W1_9PEZI|nr:hypothetical protein QBC47DRAFT_431501 [Echria macrotheca]
MPPWPTPYKAAIPFTMDNLGEAQEVNRGVWPHPHGTHPSITTSLPRILGILDKYALKATYFVEAWSLDVYPAVVHGQLLGRGHEVAWHGYQHENFGGLSAEQEEENFRRSFEAAGREGVVYRGFRPPGGKVNEGTSWRLMRGYGVGYVSPLGELGIGREGVVVLPFEWRAVDAFYYMDTDKFREIRGELLGRDKSDEVMGPEELRTYLMGRIEEVKRTGGFLSVLFHPFLQTSEERFAVFEDVVRRIAEDPEIWSVPCREVAEWVAEHGESFAGDASV